MKKINILLALLLLINVSCTKNEITETESPKGASFKIKVQAPVDTKVAIDDTTVTWAKGDEVYIIPVGVNQADVIHLLKIDETTISEDGKFAEFKGDFAPEDGSYIALTGAYVAKDEFSGKVRVSCSFLRQYASGDDAHLEYDWIMKSNVFEINKTDVPTVIFENMQSVLSLNLKMKEGESAQSFTKLDFRAEDFVFSNAVLVDDAGNVENSALSTVVELNFPESATISSTDEFTALVPIMWNKEMMDVSGDFTVTLYTADGKETSFASRAKVLSSGTLYASTLEFNDPIDVAQIEREALIALYDSTNGENWLNNDNWCTDAPLREWYGVGVDGNDRIVSILLNYNNLKGHIPSEIGCFTRMNYLDLSDNELSGVLPSSLSNLESLSFINLSYNNLIGPLPNVLSDDSDFVKSVDSWTIAPQNNGYGYDFTIEPIVEVTPGILPILSPLVSSATINIKSNRSWTAYCYNYDGSNSWVNLNANEGKGDFELELDFDANPSNTERQTTLLINFEGIQKRITIKQKPKENVGIPDFGDVEL